MSTAETIDAANAVALVDYEKRQLLHDSLAIVLAKTEEDKQRFNECFERFFSFDHFGASDYGDILANDSVNSLLDQSEQFPVAYGDGSGDDGEGQGDGEGEPALESLSGDLSPSENGRAPEVVATESDGATTGLDLSSPLLQALLTADEVAIALQVTKAARVIGLDKIQYSTQRALYSYRLLQALGIQSVTDAIKILNRADPTSEKAKHLQTAVLRLRQQAADFVEDQLLLYSDAAGKQLREDILKQANLSRIEQRYFETMQELVRKMAKALVARHSRRRRVKRRGQLDVAKTIRRNINNQGVLFDTHWKTKKKDRPNIFAICDVSGSVSAYAKFLLLFLYSLSDVLPKTRSFAFSSNLGEVTDLFQQYPVEQAIESVNKQWGLGSTSYGDAFKDFSSLAMDDIRSNSTVIILGDGRNNGGNPELPILRDIYHRCRHLIWLNPEPKSFWGTGDSEMRRYLSCVHYADTCQTLQHLESIISNILRSTD